MARPPKRRLAMDIFQDKVLVDSISYGKHLHSRRGTIKCAKLNDSLAANAEATAKISRLAKSFNDAVLPYRKNFKDGRFWPRLLSAVHACGIFDPDFHFLPLWHP